MAKRRKSASIGWLAILLLVFALGIGYAAFYYSRDLGKGIAGPKPKPSVQVEQVKEKPTLIARKMRIFLPKETATNYYLASSTRTTTSRGDILDIAMSTLLAADKENAAGSLFPAGTRLASPIRIEDGVATVNFNSTITNFSGGSDQEAMMLNALAQTVVANSAGRASKVQILVEGEKVETLGGHLEITDPIEPSDAMLQPSN